MSHFALLKPKTARTLQYLSKWSCKTISSYFCVWKNCVDISCCSRSIHSSWNSNTVSLRHRRWLRAEKMWLILLFTLVWTFKNFSFICALLCVGNPSIASTIDSTKSSRLELHEKIDCSIKLDEIDTDIGTCSPIQVVVSVSMNLSSCTQIGSKSKLPCSWCADIERV